MLMYHKDAKEPISVHPSRAEEMKRQGWTDTEPKKATPKPKLAKEVNEDGNS